jgi:hypothetical protein
MSFSPTTRTRLRLASDTAAAAASPAASDVYVKPDRVVLDNTLYVYDHCPFCVRVRIALGIKNVKHNLHFMANDDVNTPTRLVGKKIAPIFVSCGGMSYFRERSFTIFRLTATRLYFSGISRRRRAHGGINGHYRTD